MGLLTDAIGALPWPRGRDTPRDGDQDDAVTVVVDPLRCQGIGMCAHLAPGVIALDSWGFPIVPGGPVTGRERVAAGRAANGCPRRALLIEDRSAG